MPTDGRPPVAPETLWYDAGEFPGAEVRPIDPTISAGTRVARLHPAARRLAGLHARRFGTFLGAGAVGAVVANGGLVLLREEAHLSVYLAGAVSVQVAILATFALNDRLTWPGGKRRSAVHRFALFEAVNLVGLLVYLATLAVVHGALGLHYLLGGICGSAVASLWNYGANHRFVFRRGVDPGDAGEDAA